MGRTILYLQVLLVVASGLFAPSLEAQTVRPSFFAIESDSVQYTDFGGEGLPIVFIHAADRGAETWADFAPLFVDEHRVVAMTARGVAPSTGAPQPTETRVTDLLRLLDVLEIESAVFVGNSSPSLDMIELASAHPERVAGLVFLAGPPPQKEVFESDPTGAFAMAIEVTQPPIRFPYRPNYLDRPEVQFSSPALTFVTPGGTRGMERQPFPLMVAERVGQRGGDWIQDADTRTFFERLATDDELKAEVLAAWRGEVTEAILANEQAFRDAFGNSLTVVEIDVPVVTGYEYMRDQELILPPIRTFLSGLGQ